MRQLAGVFGPAVTTFDDSGALDLAAFRANIRAHIAGGLEGVVLCGSTGENPLVDDAERRALLEAAREELSREHWLIMATGAESTRQAIARTADAARLGADAALVVSPHYYTPNMTPEALRAHFTAVADAATIPILVYNIPKYVHFSIAPALMAELARHPNIHGMKDSSGDLALLAQYLEAQGDAFSVLTGSGQALNEGLALGARGGILAVALFTGGIARALYDAFMRGDHSEAARLQEVLVPLAKEIVGAMGVPGVKGALDRVGLRGGPVRSPLLPLDAASATRLDALLAAAALGVAAHA